MSEWIDEASSKVDDFFNSVDDAELEEALDEADYDFYKTVEFPSGITGEKSPSFYPLRRVRQVFGCMFSTPSQDCEREHRSYSSMNWGELRQAADDHSYAMAA
jgi:hypothetical protein